MGSETLDFLVIGAQKAGTTSLWQYLRGHTRICLPASKELPLFSAGGEPPADPGGALRALFAVARPGALQGTVTPDYMVGEQGVPVEVVAGRIAAAFPDAKLIALLRDPIDRAISSYRMAVRRGQEKRAVDDALRALLDREELENGRFRPSPCNSYLTAGEYGRLLGAYRERFPADRLLVLFTDDLDRDPGGILDRVLAFLGLPEGFRPAGLGVHHFRGGTRPLLDRESEERLIEFHREEILPFMKGSATMHRRAFEFFLEIWNVAPGERPASISPDLRVRLEDHFSADAETLVRLGESAPWTDAWKRDRPALRGSS